MQITSLLPLNVKEWMVLIVCSAESEERNIPKWPIISGNPERISSYYIPLNIYDLTLGRFKKKRLFYRCYGPVDPFAYSVALPPTPPFHFSWVEEHTRNFVLCRKLFRKFEMAFGVGWNSCRKMWSPKRAMRDLFKGDSFRSSNACWSQELRDLPLGSNLPQGSKERRNEPLTLCVSRYNVRHPSPPLFRRRPKVCKPSKKKSCHTAAATIKHQTLKWISFQFC